LAPSFDEEFFAISTYIEDRFGQRAADAIEEHFRRIALNLAHAPLMGTRGHGYSTELYGFVLSPNWVFYRFTDDEIIFLHIRDGRTDKSAQAFSG
jgi:plasmid stabilization system protein ParE